MNKKSLNNKGFSLVELIIVMAIMAVLVGALAPQYVKYLDKSRVSSDIQLADTVRQAIQITLLDPEITPAGATKNASGAVEYQELPGPSNGFWNEVYDVLGVADLATLKKELKLDATNGIIQYQINDEHKVSVAVIGGSYGTDVSDSSVVVE